MSSLTPDAYAVIEGRHSDPFRYLGPHVENAHPWSAFSFRMPRGVAVVDEHGHESDLQRIHDAGLFEGRLGNGPRHYRLRALRPTPSRDRGSVPLSADLGGRGFCRLRTHSPAGHATSCKFCRRAII
jgi:hypothetical protein